MDNVLYRLPFLDESLEDIVENGGDLCSLGPFMSGKIPFRENNESYARNRLSEFYMKCLKDVPIAAARSGTVIKYNLTREKPRNFHATNYILLDHHDGTYAKYTHVFPEVEEGT